MKKARIVRAFRVDVGVEKSYAASILRALNLELIILDRDCKNALEETRSVLRDLSVYLGAVSKRKGLQADPSLVVFSERLSVIAGEMDQALDQYTKKETGSL